MDGVNKIICNIKIKINILYKYCIIVNFYSTYKQILMLLIIYTIITYDLFEDDYLFKNLNIFY